jgi:putative ABC transport system substrate-binding protein
MQMPGGKCNPQFKCQTLGGPRPDGRIVHNVVQEYTSRMALDRRAFLVGIATAVVPWSAGAQPPRGLPARIGWISTEAQPDPFIDGFREGLRQHGYVEGQSVILDLRYTRDLEALRTAVAELTQSKVAFIVSSGPAIRAIRGARDIPVLFAISGDPVQLGLAASLGRPGGNFTGLTFLSLEIAAKRVELLKQAVPQIRTLAVLSNTDHPGEPSERRATEEAARALGLAVSYIPFTGGAQLDGGLSAVRDARADAMVVFPEGATMVARAKIARFAIAERLPSMFGWSEYADAGGLMSYGANQRQAYVRLAAYADKLLRGARTAELPIEQPTQFELVVNMRTAAALGITLPSATLLFANRRIE